MSERSTKKDVPTTTEVSVNWQGLARFLDWQGSITDLKRVELERSDRDTTESTRRNSGGRR